MAADAADIWSFAIVRGGSGASLASFGGNERTQRALGMAESRRGAGQQERTHSVGGDDQG